MLIMWTQLDRRDCVDYAKTIMLTMQTYDDLNS